MKALRSLQLFSKNKATKPALCSQCARSLSTQQPQQQGSLPAVTEAPAPTPVPGAPAAPRTEAAASAFQDLLGLNQDASSDLQNTFYQRELPSSLIRFSSDEGKRMFRSAMEAGYAEGFFPLTGNFTTQSEPAYCGPSSLAMVLNALEVDPKRRWKGNWRWYSDELLDCCASKEEMKKNGITFDKFACLAKCHSDVIAKRAPNFSLDEFRQDVESIASQSDKFMVISFSRKTLGQTGDGHFSPIGAYNPENEMVLVLDTARYKYPSYWSPLKVLYESMHPVDKETGRPRGYFLISYDQDHPPVKLCKPSDDTATQAAQPQQVDTSSSSPPPPSTPLNWATVAHSFCKRIPENMWLEKPRALDEAVQVVLRNVPAEFTRVLASQSMMASSSQQNDDQEKAKAYIRRLLADTTQSPLYPIVFRSLYPHENPIQQQADNTQVDQQAAFATLFILGSPRMLYTSLPRDVQETLDAYRKNQYMTDVVQREVKRIAHEVAELTKSFCTCGPGWSSDAIANGNACCQTST
ncbi:Phytochelatin synthase-domain-containing protein [Gongronella butleri]|nr:Phytochelatin synthase-domain-containing protein [Gongronella butleri]